MDRARNRAPGHRQARNQFGCAHRQATAHDERRRVRPWAATHGDWAIDPEPLIIYTASFGDDDPRLRDEATDWCTRYWRFVSKTRLKNLLRGCPESVVSSFGEFAATVGTHGGLTWPGATVPRPYNVTGRSSLPPLSRPSLVWLRLRVMFGLGARTEILRCFLSRPASDGVSVSDLAVAIGYTKGNTADECEMLERAGVLTVRTSGNRHQYAIARRGKLEAFVGVLPAVAADWPALLHVAHELVEFERDSSNTERTTTVRARRTLDRITDDLVQLGVGTSAADARGAELEPALQQLGVETLGECSIGRWPSG